jgi:hypothetical protein
MDHLCACGCGQQTNIIKTNNTKKGRVKGQYSLFIAGHHKRLPESVAYVISPRGYKTDCWTWIRSKDSHGYGAIRRDGKAYRAHRYFYEMHRGAIPEGMQLDHLCRNPDCVNPDHLEPVTNRENVLRGRTTKVTQQIADKIRHLRSLGFRESEVAEVYGISTSHVWRITAGKCW